jgi:hypothetical protein
MDPEYRKLHEAFVSNSSGTSAEEIVVVSCSIPLSLVLIAFTAKVSNLGKMQTFGYGKTKMSTSKL